MRNQFLLSLLPLFLLFSVLATSTAAPDAASQNKTKTAETATKQNAEKRSLWNGYELINFKIAGRACRLVRPKTPAPGNPWLWRAEFFSSATGTDVALLKKGFHVAHINVSNLFGAPVALDAMDVFYDHIVNVRHLSPKPVLIGVSRGGLYALNWAIRHPERAGALYLDAPVCDFKSWPGGRGKGKGGGKREWALLLKAYGFKSDAEALAYKGNPVDTLAPLAKARVPIISVVGTADTTVPLEENTDILAKRYRALGGEILVIRKEGVGHHPHGLEDSTPIADFVLRNTRPQAQQSD
jgi:pimeloyl-ACP methyl ester carboxylesterase